MKESPFCFCTGSIICSSFIFSACISLFLCSSSFFCFCTSSILLLSLKFDELILTGTVLYCLLEPLVGIGLFSLVVCFLSLLFFLFSVSASLWPTCLGCFMSLCLSTWFDTSVSCLWWLWWCFFRLFCWPSSTAVLKKTLPVSASFCAGDLWRDCEDDRLDDELFEGDDVRTFSEDKWWCLFLLELSSFSFSLEEAFLGDEERLLGELCREWCRR